MPILFHSLFYPCVPPPPPKLFICRDQTSQMKRLGGRGQGTAGLPPTPKDLRFYNLCPPTAPIKKTNHCIFLFPVLYYSMNKLIIENAITDELLFNISISKKHIYAFIYYAKIHTTHRNDNAKKILDALISAKKRNVTVKVLLNNQVDQNKQPRSNQKFAGLLALASVEAKLSRKGRLTHAKTWIFDDSRVIIGSHNITLRSTKISREVSIYVEDVSINKKLTDYFLQEFNNKEEL